MLSSMAVEIPEKGKFFIHMMGQKQEATYIVKSVDLSSNSFNVETTTEGEDGEMELESGTFTINGETLALSGGKEDGPVLLGLEVGLAVHGAVVTPGSFRVSAIPAPCSAMYHCSSLYAVWSLREVGRSGR